MFFILAYRRMFKPNIGDFLLYLIPKISDCGPIIIHPIAFVNA